MLSQLGNGKLVPTLPTSARIAMVFDVGLEHFFGEERVKRTFAIVRAEDPLRFPINRTVRRHAATSRRWLLARLQEPVLAYFAEFPKIDANDLASHFHDGSEFIHVLEGVLAVN